jgi:hypothetical protein
MSPQRTPEKIGDIFGRLVIIDDIIVRKGYEAYLNVRCTSCGEEGLRLRNNLRKGIAGCRRCGMKSSVPKWLLDRAIGAKQRCTNPNSPEYHNYGARGIEFRFSSPTSMATWIKDNIGLHRDMQIDRVDNNGHYEPGNLRWATSVQNCLNSRKQRVTFRFHAFRRDYPEIRYADATLRRLLNDLTDDEIIAKYNAPSQKPRGKYGTISLPDLDIAAQYDAMK